MKQITLFLIVLFFYFDGQSQIYGTPLKGAYCYGNPEHNFTSELSEQSKIVFNNFIESNKIDTTRIYRVNYDEIFSKFGTREYLSNHGYTYVSWYNYKGTVKIEEKVSYNGYNTSKPDKLIVLYTTNKSDIEHLSFYFTN